MRTLFRLLLLLGLTVSTVAHAQTLTFDQLLSLEQQSAPVVDDYIEKRGWKFTGIIRPSDTANYTPNAIHSTWSYANATGKQIGVFELLQERNGTTILFFYTPSLAAVDVIRAKMLAYQMTESTTQDEKGQWITYKGAHYTATLHPYYRDGAYWYSVSLFRYDQPLVSSRK